MSQSPEDSPEGTKQPLKRWGRKVLDSPLGQKIWGASFAQKILNPIHNYQTQYLALHVSSGNKFIRDLGKYNIAKPIGRCLVSYATWFADYLCQHPSVGIKGWDPVTLSPKIDALSHEFPTHTMHWVSVEIIRQLIERGYIVDCVFDRIGSLVEDVTCYDVIIDEWNNLPLWTSQNPHARTLYYATGCHWLFHNRAELLRHEWLFARRGVEVPAKRQLPPLLGPGEADLVSYTGFEKQKATFGVHAPKTRKLWTSLGEILDTTNQRDWETARKRFIWFGSSGWVHKGLDLTIEAFLKEPQLQLIICGRDLESDGSLWKTYGVDIEKADNISYFGFVNPLGSEFRELALSACAVVFPSAAEGSSGAVLQCLQYGLIPVVTEITGIGVHQDWAPLTGNTDHELIEQIRQRCTEISSMPEKQFQEWSDYFEEYVRKNHNRASYRQSLSNVLDELLG